MEVQADDGQQHYIQQHEQIQQLQHRIVDLESNLERAALFGKQLLEQLNQKSVECEELLEHRTQLDVEVEDLRQRRHSAERLAELSTAREQNALAELDLLKPAVEENDRLRDEKRALEERLKVSILEKERRLQNATELEEELKATRTQLAIARAEIKEYEQKESSRKDLSTTDIVPDSDPDHAIEMAARLVEAHEETDRIKQQLNETIHQRESLSANFNKYKVLVEEARQDKASLENDLAYYMNAIREKNHEITELKEEIDSIKASQTDPERRGNSIFAEVEDRRLEVEVRLAQAIARLRGADEVKRRLRCQLAQCYASMLTLSRHTSKADQNYIDLLEKEVMRLRNQLFACSAQFGSKIKDETFTEKDLQINPLAGLLMSERSCTSGLKKRIQELIAQEDGRTNEIIRLGSDLRKSESVAEKLKKELVLLMQRQETKDAMDDQSTDPTSLKDSESQKRTEMTVVREVVSEVFEENMRTLEREQKIDANVDQDAEDKTSTSADGDPTEGPPNEAMTIQPNSSLDPKEQCQSDDKLSFVNERNMSDECQSSVITRKADAKKVDFAQGTSVDDANKQTSQMQKPRGRQVTVLKKTKVQGKPEDCSTQ